MECSKCGSVWNVPKERGQIISKCPFCGESLCEATENNIEEHLRWIIDNYGLEILKNKNDRFISILADLLPHQKRERRAIKEALDAGISKTFFLLAEKAIKYDDCANVIRNNLSTATYLNEEIINNICQWFLGALACEDRVKSCERLENDITEQIVNSDTKGTHNEKEETFSRHQSKKEIDYREIYEEVVKLNSCLIEICASVEYAVIDGRGKELDVATVLDYRNLILKLKELSKRVFFIGIATYMDEAGYNVEGEKYSDIMNKFFSMQYIEQSHVLSNMFFGGEVYQGFRIYTCRELIFNPFVPVEYTSGNRKKIYIRRDMIRNNEEIYKGRFCTATKPSEEHFQEEITRGYNEWEQGRVEEAKKIFANIKDDGRYEATAQMYLAKILLLAGEKEEVIFKCYARAAELGDSNAQNIVGNMIENGEGVEQNLQLAIKWYKMSANSNNRGAQHNLGVLYMMGEGVEKDYTKAFEMFSKAAHQGHSGSQNNLGVMYENGLGVDKNRTMAIKWYREASDNGNEDGENNYMRLNNA